MSRPYPCIYCTEDGHCKKFSDEKTVSWCVLGPCQDEKPSNGDRIRAMSDEELAEEIVKCRDADYFRKTVFGMRMNTTEEWLDWLKEEAEDDTDRE